VVSTASATGADAADVLSKLVAVAEEAN